MNVDMNTRKVNPSSAAALDHNYTTLTLLYTL